MKKKCIVCLQIYATTNKNQQCCSRFCANSKRKRNYILKICEICGKEYETYLSKKQKCCSLDCKNKFVSKKLKQKGIPKNWHPEIGFKKKEKNIMWKGGRFKSGSYILVHSPKHPCRNSSGYVMEHRLIMEKKIGRFLTKKEVIHHLDHNKSNNSLDNLFLFESTNRHVAYHELLKSIVREVLKNNE
jgi:hypothetical protein